METEGQHTRAAGRGFVSITAAKVFFILTGYSVQLLLPRLFGKPELFGLFASTMSLISIVNNVLIASTLQTVSRFVSAEPTQDAQLLRQGLKLHLMVGAVLSAAVVGTAAVVANHVLYDAKVTQILQIAGTVFIWYAVYACLVGAMNGRKRFGTQAGLDIAFASLRTVGVLLPAALGFGVIGAVGGFAGAAALIVIVALLVVGAGRTGQGVPINRWFAFAGPVFLFQMFLNAVMQIDLAVLKRNVSLLAIAAGNDFTSAAELASRYAGYYKAAQTFAFVPYHLNLAVAFVVFPLVSSVTSGGELGQAKTYVRGALRFSLLALAGLTAPIAGAAPGVMRLAYPDAYLAGADAMRVLVFAQAAFALFVVCATIINSSGRPVISAWVAGAGLIIVVAANTLFVHRVGLGKDTLAAAAWGTLVGTSAALLVMSAIVYRRFRTWIAPWSVVRVGMSAGIAYGVSAALPYGHPLWGVGGLVIGGGVYLLSLTLLRELRAGDLQTLRRALSRK